MFSTCFTSKKQYKDHYRKKRPTCEKGHQETFSLNCQVDRGEQHSKFLLRWGVAKNFRSWKQRPTYKKEGPAIIGNIETQEARLILQSGTDTFLLPNKHFFLLHGLTYNDKIIKSKDVTI